MQRNSEVTMLPSKKELELKKHVAIIHSNNKLTLLQRKIANALLWNAYKNLRKAEKHKIHIAKLCEIIGYDSNDHKSIKIALMNLISTVLEWNLLDSELGSEGAWNASSIIAGATIEGTMCTYSYSTQMRELLYRPHMYGRVDMAVQAKFQSTYGLALYENCNRFQDIGQTPWFTVEQFRKLMGVEEGKYKIFRDFKNRVLKKAIEEVNKYSPLNIDAQMRKQSRRVVSIQFLIQKSECPPLVTPLPKPKPSQEDRIDEVLKGKFGLSARKTGQIRKAYDDDYIKEKIDLILSSGSFKNAKIKNLATYLLSALRDDYQDIKANVPKRVVSQKSEQKREVIVNKSDIDLQMKFRRFQESELFKLFNELSPREKANVTHEFEKFLVGMYQHVYLREGLENILIQEQLSFFLKKTNHELVRQLPAYEEWLGYRCRVD